MCIQHMKNVNFEKIDLYIRWNNIRFIVVSVYVTAGNNLCDRKMVVSGWFVFHLYYERYLSGRQGRSGLVVMYA